MELKENERIKINYRFLKTGDLMGQEREQLNNEQVSFSMVKDIKTLKNSFDTHITEFAG